MFFLSFTCSVRDESSLNDKSTLFLKYCKKRQSNSRSSETEKGYKIKQIKTLSSKFLVGVSI